MRILGIDPGSVVTGFGLIVATEGRLTLAAAGALRMPRKADLGARIAGAADGLARIIREHSPEEICLENIFYHASVRSALVLAHLRGALMLEVTRSGIPLYEYSALEVKKALAGHGHADKEQVRGMVKRLLRLDTLPRPHDVSDALAVAICHAHAGPVKRRWESA